MPWYYNPHIGGIKIPPHLHDQLRRQVQTYERTKTWYPKVSIKLRFKAQFCYLDSCENGVDIFPLARLRYFPSQRWSLALFTYSHERYEPCMFAGGEDTGTIQQAIDICELYLDSKGLTVNNM